MGSLQRAGPMKLTQQQFAALGSGYGVTSVTGGANPDLRGDAYQPLRLPAAATTTAGA